MNMITTTEFKVWRTIKLGTLTSKELQHKLSGLMPNNYYAWEAIEHKPVAPKEMEVDLVNLSLEELGLIGDWIGMKDAREKVLELGLELCPPEIGPQLRLQYGEQRKGETLAIAMLPFSDDPRYPMFYELQYCWDKPTLSVTLCVFNQGVRIIAIKPRKQETAV